MIDEFKEMLYVDLRTVVTLETRRLRGDLIEVFKILKGFENIFFKSSRTE